MTDIQTNTIQTLAQLGQSFANPTQALQNTISVAQVQNPWFTSQNTHYALQAFSAELTEEKLTQFVSSYPYPTSSVSIALILAGNIPLVGLHDIICVLLSGHKAIIKPSATDRALVDYVIEFIRQNNTELGQRISIVDKIPKDFDGVIATGSANTARYFDYYFADKPSIIRSSRSSIAVITASTTDKELKLLAEDIMLYFGMGCRNVTLLFIPQDFDLQRIVEALVPYQHYAHHHKYKSNYDYYRTIYAMGGVKDYVDTGYAILLPSQNIKNPVSVISYQYYKDISVVETFIKDYSGHIQCVVGGDHLPYGASQHPKLSDYADGEDTMFFLSKF